MSLSFHYVIKLLSSHWQHLTSAPAREGVRGILRYFSYLEEQRSLGFESYDFPKGLFGSQIYFGRNILVGLFLGLIKTYIPHAWFSILCYKT